MRHVLAPVLLHRVVLAVELPNHSREPLEGRALGVDAGRVGARAAEDRRDIDRGRKALEEGEERVVVLPRHEADLRGLLLGRGLVAGRRLEVAVLVRAVVFPVVKRLLDVDASRPAKHPGAQPFVRPREVALLVRGLARGAGRAGIGVALLVLIVVGADREGGDEQAQGQQLQASANDSHCVLDEGV